MDPEVALFFYKSVIRLYIEYCCHVWAGTPRCYLNMLLHKRVFRTVIPSLSASLERLTHCRNVASLSLSCRYYFSRSSYKLAKMIRLLILAGDPLVVLLGCMIFLSPFRDFRSMSILFICGFLLNRFLTCSTSLSSSFSYQYITFSSCTALHGVNPSFKKVHNVDNLSSTIRDKNLLFF